jgi:phage terminase small subunit
MVPETQEERRFPNLTAMQEAFATNYVANGGNGKRAAIAAGYAKGSAHVEASKMLRKPPIVGAIGELSMMQLASHAPGAIARIARLSDKAKSEYVQLEASKDVLTRLGLTAPTRVHHSGNVSISIRV